MRIFKKGSAAIIENIGKYYVKENIDWDKFINRKDLFKSLIGDLKGLEEVDSFDIHTIKEAPMGSQEIWASGVTYMRSKEARMEESKKAGGGSFYDRVYVADRPELFFKATAHRTVGPFDKVRIRKDSGWDVPEPELTLFISSEGTIEGYTIGNDMSSRSIEGENPLYLPQAKTYDKSAALGPCIYVTEGSIAPDTIISLEIIRAAKTVFSGKIPISNMKRKHQELADYLFRECSFVNGVFLMTGTGIIPPDDFTLQSGDEIRIQIENIGTLVNFVE